MTHYLTQTVVIGGRQYTAGTQLPKTVRQGVLQSLIQTGRVTETKPGTTDSEAADDELDVDSDLFDLDLDQETIKVLLANQIKSIDQLRAVTDLQTLPKIGKGRAKTITAALEQFLAADPDDSQN